MSPANDGDDGKDDAERDKAEEAREQAEKEQSDRTDREVQRRLEQDGGRTRSDRETAADSVPKQAEHQDSEAAEQEEVRRLKTEYTEREAAKDFPEGTPPPPESMKVRYVEAHAYAEELRRAHPELPDSDIDRFIGLTDNNRVVVNDGSGNTIVTGLHEVHHREGAHVIPGSLEEGFVEHTARQRFGGVGLYEVRVENGELRSTAPVKAYEEEVGVVTRIEAIVGSEPLQEAHYGGDETRLRRELDTHLGGGAYDEIRELMDKDRAKEAQAVIDRRWRRRAF